MASTPAALESVRIDDPRFSQTFELPANPAEGRTAPFRVRYADYGYRRPCSTNARPSGPADENGADDENVLLFFGPLLCSRLVHIAKDELAKQHKIRFLMLDRPGIGGTDALDEAHRGDHGYSMSLWRETVLALLAHLGIRRVSVACHSGGTVFALDLLVHHPEVLRADRPFLAIGAPWILPAHTSSAVMAAAQSLPRSIVGQVDKAARLFNNHIAPVVGASVGLSTTLAAKLVPAPKPPRPQDGATAAAGDAANRAGVQREEDLWPRVMERIFEEGVQGLSSDAQLLLQKSTAASPPGWSDWGDYDTLVPRLAEAMRASGRRLRVKAFFSETDVMIGGGGTKGPRWFDQCWDAEGVGDAVEYSSTIVEGADHDGIWLMRWGVMHEVFESIAPMAEAEADS